MLIKIDEILGPQGTRTAMVSPNSILNITSYTGILEFQDGSSFNLVDGALVGLCFSEDQLPLFSRESVFDILSKIKSPRFFNVTVYNSEKGCKFETWLPNHEIMSIRSKPSRHQDGTANPNGSQIVFPRIGYVVFDSVEEISKKLENIENLYLVRNH